MVRRAHLACKISYPGQKKESAESLQSKSHLKKGQVSSKNHFRERIKHFLQWICPSKGKRLEEPLQKFKPAADTAQSHRTVKSHLITDSKAVEAQALMTVVGQILEEKMVLHCGPHTSELNWYKVELQAPLGPPYCYHGFLSCQGQRRMMRQTAHQQQATPTGHRCPTRGQAQGQRMALPTQGPVPVRAEPASTDQVTAAAGHSGHCPRHCLPQKYPLLSQNMLVTAFLVRKVFSKRKMYTMLIKTCFPLISTSSLC